MAGLRRLFARQPLDEQGQKTLFVGLLLSGGLYLAAIFAPRFAGPDFGAWLSLALMMIALVMMVSWFLAVRGGFRLGKPKSRGERRAKMHAKQEKEKRMRLNR